MDRIGEEGRNGFINEQEHGAGIFVLFASMLKGSQLKQAEVLLEQIIANIHVQGALSLALCTAFSIAKSG